MKKLLLFLTLTLLSTVATFAQSTLIGTLSHNGEITVFHGSDALIQAHNAAVDGDVITLSAGNFACPTIYRPVTIRGAGMFPEKGGTTLVGEVNILVPEEVEGGYVLTMEGIYASQPVKLGATSVGTSFVKCYFKGGIIRSTVRFNNNNVSATVRDTKFIHCIIENSTSLTYSLQTALEFNNCVVENICTQSRNNSSTMLDHCIVSNANVSPGCENAAFSNCILTVTSNLRSTCSILNSKIITENPEWISGCSNIGGELVSPLVLIFKENSKYELLDELVSTWIGADGTQIGIYGGSMPFDPTPLNPQITKFNVASKTSADGKLSVDIEVKAME